MHVDDADLPQVSTAGASADVPPPRFHSAFFNIPNGADQRDMGSAISARSALISPMRCSRHRPVSAGIDARSFIRKRRPTNQLMTLPHCWSGMFRRSPFENVSPRTSILCSDLAQIAGPVVPPLSDALARDRSLSRVRFHFGHLAGRSMSFGLNQQCSSALQRYSLECRCRARNLE